MQHITLATSMTALAAFCLLSPLAAQQTKVIPAANAATEGSISAAYPFGYTNPRVQQVWIGSAVTSSVALISGISYRMNAGNPSNPEAARAYTGVTMAIGTTTVSPGTLSTTFASNITSPLTTVISGNYNLPAQATPAPSPAPFNIPIAWTQPYVFTAAQGHLIFDITLPGTIGKSDYILDGEYSTATPTGVVAPFGRAGSFSKPEPASLGADANALAPGGSLTIGCGPFSSSYPGSLVLGISNQSWGAVSLPLDLTIIGAPRNNLYVSMNLQLPFSTTASGPGFASLFQAPIPNNPAYQGLTLFSQAYYADAAANAAGLVATQGLRLTTGNSTGGPTTNTVGYWDSTQTIGEFAFGKTLTGGAVVQFTGVLP